MHLANHISSLKLQQPDSLTASTATTHSSLPQHSRLAALTLPLTLPATHTQPDPTPKAAKLQQRSSLRAAKPPLIPGKTALQRLTTEPLPEQAVSVAVQQMRNEEPPLLPPQRPEHQVGIMEQSAWLPSVALSDTANATSSLCRLRFWHTSMSRACSVLDSL